MTDVSSTSTDSTQSSIMAQMSAMQDQSAEFGAQEFAQQMQAEQNLTQISDAQNQANNFMQTMASNAKSAVAKD
ncbi:hypothetical protein [Tanticharoenia sakaeratensis]|jgi:hypothetical protein|uniref:Uncharacterized protein n=1 Tax=Tanticharoenia sakaeratensis NBRC 103193 TaxID=1231623 RepID=A0A0D6MMS4_9PROT|nr:hypothetical protein [Tanticharoenia sakaeratensis]GAN54982.1 hypothetical protein Tasa_035_017 [Tanticharoenia sakaeratensis NBRC 103193]GBQ16623.1 hypothetical protein AA103193_0049 [Tanticharoenia sakaeratensis NBRC 103193]